MTVSQFIQPEPGKQRPSSTWLQRVAATLRLSANPDLRETLERSIAGAADDDPLLAQERAMLLNILSFGDVKAGDVMVPRADVIGIAEGRTVGSLIRLFADAGHSRIPVYRNSLDDASGMVHIKDAVAWATKEATRIGSGPVAEVSELNFDGLSLGKTIAEVGLVREVLYVPPSMPAIELLARMRARQIHLALIVDEHGGIDGLVSIEDLVEEIVGDIADEHDTDELPFLGVEGDGLLASAKIPIEEVEQRLVLRLTAPGATEEVDTLGGLILAMVGSVPKRGTVVPHPSGVSFEIMDAGPRRIHKVKISRTPPSVAFEAQMLLPSLPGQNEPEGGTLDARAA